MPMEVTIANPQALRLLNADMQSLGRDFAQQTRMRGAWERVRDEVNIPSIAQNFKVGGRPRWEPVAPTTSERSPSRRGVLDVTGQLKRAATAKARFSIKKNEMTFGNWPASRWWGPVHDFGSKDGAIPKRQFVMIKQPEDAEHIGEILMEWIESRVNANIKMHYV